MVLHQAFESEKMDDSVTALPGQHMYCNHGAAEHSGNICVHHQGTATGNGDADLFSAESVAEEIRE